MAKCKKKQPSPLSIRFNEQERAAIENAAAGISISAYIRSRVFDETVPPRRTRGKSPVKDHQILGRILGEFGASGKSSDLNQLAKASNSGSLPVTPETEAALRDACTDVQKIKHMLMRALGIQAGDDAS